MKTKNMPLVSILCITYNHEKYIHEALDGFLMQKTNFPIEIIIADDASTDGNQEIIKNYQKKYPELIKPILRKNNIGPQPNWIDAAKKCQGKYIAMCEGDDYWTDPYKLQKQVDFLEKNQEYTICFHKVNIKENDKHRDDCFTSDVQETTDIYDLAKGNYIHTPSCLFRFIKIPKWLSGLPIGDFPLHIHNAQYGKIKKLNFIGATYRVHRSGIWMSASPASKKKAAFDMSFGIYKNLEHPVKMHFKNASINLFHQLYKNNNATFKQKLQYFIINPKSFSTYLILVGLKHFQLKKIIALIRNVLK